MLQSMEHKGRQSGVGCGRAGPTSKQRQRVDCTCDRDLPKPQFQRHRCAQKTCCTRPSLRSTTHVTPSGTLLSTSMEYEAVKAEPTAGSWQRSRRISRKVFQGGHKIAEGGRAQEHANGERRRMARQGGVVQDDRPNQRRYNDSNRACPSHLRRRPSSRARQR